MKLAKINIAKREILEDAEIVYIYFNLFLTRVKCSAVNIKKGLIAYSSLLWGRKAERLFF